MKARFYVNPILCSGCRTCELACSFAHGVNGKPGRSRIYPLDGGFKDIWVPVACLQEFVIDCGHLSNSSVYSNIQ